MAPDAKLPHGALHASALLAQKWLTPVFRGLAILAALAGTTIVVLIGASVFMRHVTNSPLHFTEELVGLLMTAAFFLALPLATLNAEHVRVSILVVNLPQRQRRWAGMGASVFGLGFCLWYFALCLPWLDFAFQRTLKTEVARLLMYPWMALIPLSLILTAVAFVVRGLIGEQPARTSS
ncbi:MAG: TRAP transporter small permease [Hyphomicrobiales bacterium]|nr:TRAP transporter small permease [Hyphomicrobiales bacterium]